MDPLEGATNLQGLTRRGTVRAIDYGGDDGAFVKFFDKGIYLTKQSEIEGRPVYKTVPWVHHTRAGEKQETIEPLKFGSEEALEQGLDKKGWAQRFPEQWEAYRKNAKVANVGTPLESWPNPKMDPGRIAEMKAQNVFSVEHLAALSDTALQNLGMGVRELRTQAQAWIKAAKDAAPMNALVEENKRLGDEIEALKQQFRELAGEAPKPVKRKGRPKGSKNKESLAA